ncbi:DNA transposase THAP9 isoform X3, partial [Scomber scombrus]
RPEQQTSITNQFESRFMKLLVRCRVDPGQTGNALPLDTGEPLSAAAVNERDAYQPDSSFVNTEHSDLPAGFSAVIKSRASDIAGWFVRKLKPPLTPAERL